MSSTISPNMNLIIPGVGTEAGPQYAIDIDNTLGIIDQHTHAPGSGVLITPSAININTALTFNANFATNVAGLTLSAQSTQPAVNTVYESGVDLYFVDGLGNNIRITQSGGVAGTPGSIANLVAPASASYVAGSSTFVWQSNTNIAANMDFGAAILRNLSPNSTYGLTLQPPAALSNDFTLTLPVPPSTLSFVVLDPSGNFSATSPFPLQAPGIEALAVITSKIDNLAVTTGKLADGAVVNAKITDATIDRTKLNADNFSNLVTLVWQETTSFVVPAGVTGAVVTLVGGGGGGGGGFTLGGGGGAGGNSGAIVVGNVLLTPGETVVFTRGAGGAGGAITSGGADGAASTFAGSFGNMIAFGGLGGASGGASTGGAANSSVIGPWLQAPGGRGADSSTANSAAGSSSPRALNGGPAGAGNAGGGGGGSAIDLGGALGTAGAGGASGSPGTTATSPNNGAGGGGGGSGAAGGAARNGCAVFTYIRGVA